MVHDERVPFGRALLAAFCIELFVYGSAGALEITEAANEHKVASFTAIQKWDNPKRIFYCDHPAKTCTKTDAMFSDILSLENSGAGSKARIDFTSDEPGKGLLTASNPPGAGDLFLIEPADPTLGVSVLESTNGGKSMENITLFGEDDPNPRDPKLLSDRLTFCTMKVTTKSALEDEVCVPDPEEVPEPPSHSLLGPALVGLLGYGWWRRRYGSSGPTTGSP